MLKRWSTLGHPRFQTLSANGLLEQNEITYIAIVSVIVLLVKVDCEFVAKGASLIWDVTQTASNFGRLIDQGFFNCVDIERFIE